MKSCHRRNIDVCKITLDQKLHEEFIFDMSEN